MPFGFFLYVPNPLCTELTLPKPQTLMLCCRVPPSQAVSCCSSHSGYSSLLPELGMHPVFLSTHPNKMWSLYAVEMAGWDAGLGHVLHASDKKYRQCKSTAHHVAKVAGNREDRTVSPHIQIGGDLLQITALTSPSLLWSPLRLHHRLKNSPTVGEDYLQLNRHYFFLNTILFQFSFLLGM